MPDVNLAYDAGLIDEGRFVGGLSPAEFREKLRAHVAIRMFCLDDEGNPLVHLPHQITFIGFSPLPDSGGDKLVVIQIFAYDWPDRMKRIDRNMKSIGKRVRQLLKLPEGTVDVSFIKIHRGSSDEAPGWVNV